MAESIVNNKNNTFLVWQKETKYEERKTVLSGENLSFFVLSSPLLAERLK